MKLCFTAKLHFSFSSEWQLLFKKKKKPVEKERLTRGGGAARLVYRQRVRAVGWCLMWSEGMVTSWRWGLWGGWAGGAAEGMNHRTSPAAGSRDEAWLKLRGVSLTRGGRNLRCHRFVCLFIAQSLGISHVPSRFQVLGTWVPEIGIPSLRASHLIREKDKHRPRAGRGRPLGILAVVEERLRGHLSALKEKQGFAE